MDVDLGLLYGKARERITGLVLEAGPSRWNDVVPAAPDWQVHDVVGHLRGVVEDALSGNMAGAPGDAWTAAQVERNRLKDVRVLLDEWTTDAPAFEGFLSSAGVMGAAGVIDVHTHEQDLRGALGEPATLPDDFARWALAVLVEGRAQAVAEAGLPALRAVTHEGDELGAADAPSVLRSSRFELFRTLLGRRSAAQVAALIDAAGGVEADAYVGALCVFGPRTEPLVEPTP